MREKWNIAIWNFSIPAKFFDSETPSPSVLQFPGEVAL